MSNNFSQANVVELNIILQSSSEETNLSYVTKQKIKHGMYEVVIYTK